MTYGRQIQKKIAEINCSLFLRSDQQDYVDMNTGLLFHTTTCTAAITRQEYRPIPPRLTILLIFEDSSKICQENSVSLKPDQNNGTLHEHPLRLR
jgi:hypothetical protein